MVSPPFPLSASCASKSYCMGRAGMHDRSSIVGAEGTPECVDPLKPGGVLITGRSWAAECRGVQDPPAFRRFEGSIQTEEGQHRDIRADVVYSKRTADSFRFFSCRRLSRCRG